MADNDPMLEGMMDSVTDKPVCYLPHFNNISQDLK